MVNEMDQQAAFERFLSRPILVPLSGTDVAEGILPCVGDLAKKANVPLLLHGVIDPESSNDVHALRDLTGAEHLDDRGVEEGSEDELKESHQEGMIAPRDWAAADAKSRAADRLNEVARDLEQQGIHAEVHVTFGNPPMEILRVAEEEKCGLIAMSTHGRNPVARGVLGSVTDQVVHHAALPVLTVTPHKARQYREAEGSFLNTVILPLDGSELAERARPYVEKLARSLSLEVLLVRVVHLEYQAYATGWYADMSGMSYQLEPQAVKYLQSVAQGLEWKELEVKTKAMRGSPTQALLNIAQETPNSIIAMTTHGRSGVSRWLMGSVSDAMVRASGDPVLIIPAILRPKVNAMERQALAQAVNA